MNYEKFMRLAIDIAKQNAKAPYGAVLVDTETEAVVATGLNQTRSNPILHGEIAAINNYASLNTPHWERLILFTTAEPCCMCQAAIIWSGIPKVVFGTSISTLAELGWNQFSYTAQQVTDAAQFSDCQLIGNVLCDETDPLFVKHKAWLRQITN